MMHSRNHRDLYTDVRSLTLWETAGTIALLCIQNIEEAEHAIGNQLCSLEHKDISAMQIVRKSLSLAEVVFGCCRGMVSSEQQQFVEESFADFRQRHRALVAEYSRQLSADATLLASGTSVEETLNGWDHDRPKSPRGSLHFELVEALEEVFLSRQ